MKCAHQFLSKVYPTTMFKKWKIESEKWKVESYLLVILRAEPEESLK